MESDGKQHSNDERFLSWRFGMEEWRNGGDHDKGNDDYYYRGERRRRMNQDSGKVLLMLNDFVYFDVDESSMTPWLID